jgi:hypothetical protein
MKRVSQPIPSGLSRGDDPTMIGYVRQLSGLALIGEVRDHVLPFM